MCDDRTPFYKFILESAGKYLQTVVLVDDRIYENTSGSVASRLMTPSVKLRKAALKSAEAANERKEAADEQTGIAEKPEEVSFHDVQNSFAKKRIICSLYQPKKIASFGEHSDVYNLCSSADVVIVDWDLHGDSGNKATALVRNLIEQSMKEIPHQLRLVLIYTMEVNLRSVADKLYEDLGERIGKETIGVDTETKGLVLTTDNARVVVLGKRENTSLTEYSDFWVPEKKLAERTISEFSRLASGLLQAVVLRGVANLRENNRRILMRFHEGLDTAFLVHRTLLLPDEAFRQIIPLLTDELRAVLEDTLGDSPLGTAPAVERIVTDWCVAHWKPSNNPQLNIGVGANALEFAKDVFCNGPAIKKDYSRIQKSEVTGLVDKKESEYPKWNEKKSVKLAEYLSTDSNGNFCHEKLSSLMSQRIAYENASRALHLGVILREVEGNRRYMLCLQPVCDSVRINGKTRTFIFCFLDVPDAGKSFTHAVVDLSRNLIRLAYIPKVSNCYVTNFMTGADTVCAAKDNERGYIFEDAGKIKYEWIAELKTEHAQRAAEDFGRTLSRVGLTESEWLRLKAKQTFG
jgi:hypothetical protein